MLVELIRGSLDPQRPGQSVTTCLCGEGSVPCAAWGLGPLGCVPLSACLGIGCCGGQVSFPLRAQFLLHVSECELAKVATGTGFCFSLLLLSYLSFSSFLF